MSKTCFVICPLGEHQSETRRRTESVIKHLIRPAVEPFGYNVKPPHEIDDAGMITNHIIQMIISSDLVIADLTDRNPNVFYELAIRHASRKPLVQIIKEGESLPFDVAGMRTFRYDLKDPDSVADTKQHIYDQVDIIHTTETLMDTPISHAIDYDLLRRSERPEDNKLADLLVASYELRSGLEELRASTLSLPDRFSELVSSTVSPNSGPMTYDNHTAARMDIQNYIETSLISNTKDKTNIKLIAVALRFSWPFLVEILPKLLKRHKHSHVHIQLATVDPNYLRLHQINDWADAAEDCNTQIRNFHKHLKPSDRISIDLTHYQGLLPWHGMLIDESNLFFGRADWNFDELNSTKCQLTVGQNTYRHFNKNDVYGGSSRIRLFNNWLKYFKIKNPSITVSDKISANGP